MPTLSLDLAVLWGSFSDMLERFGTTDPDEADPVVQSVISSLEKIDPVSYPYRYPVKLHGDPVPIKYAALDLSQFSEMMTAVAGYLGDSDGFSSERGG